MSVPLVCPVCNRSLPNALRLARHVAMHDAARPVEGSVSSVPDPRATEATCASE